MPGRKQPNQYGLAIFVYYIGIRWGELLSGAVVAEKSG
jgi:hypothetical protein